MIEEGWERFFDDKEQHYYLYNAATQESKWEEGGVNPQESEEAWKGGVRWGGAGEGWQRGDSQDVTDAGVRGRSGEQQQQQEEDHHHQEEEDDDEEEGSSGGGGGGGEEALREEFAPRSTQPGLPRVTGDPRQDESTAAQQVRFAFSVEEGEADLEDPRTDDEERLMPPPRWRMRYDLVKKDTANILRWYNCCFFFHACACEAPFAAAEALVHGAALLFVAGLMGAGAALVYLAEPRKNTTDASGAALGQDETLSGYMFSIVRRWGREGLLFMASAASLVLCPCSACAIYRGFSAEEEDEWNLSPLPTLLGAVDPRRFGTFVFGQGSDAGNVDLPEDIKLSGASHTSAISGSGAGGVLQFSSLSTPDLSSTLGAPQLGCMDSWTGDVLFPPRRIRSILPPICLQIFNSFFMAEELSDDATNGLSTRHQQLPTDEVGDNDETGTNHGGHGGGGGSNTRDVSKGAFTSRSTYIDTSSDSSGDDTDDEEEGQAATTDMSFV